MGKEVTTMENEVGFWSFANRHPLITIVILWTGMGMAYDAIHMITMAKVEVSENKLKEHQAKK
jgi:hypothetical protein